MSKYTKIIALTPKEDQANVSKSLKTSIHKHTGFGNIKDPSQSMSIDSSKSAGYSPEVITLAGQLKYQHEHDYTPSGDSTQKFSDEFYLEYAKKMLHTKFASNFDSILSGIDTVPDPKYAQYSYEEIIAMANNGVNIPKNVLAWAKAQQQADITEYIVVSDNAEFNDDYSKDKESGESETNKIRAEVKDYAIKSKKAQEDITKNKEKTEELTDKATDIAKKQRDLFKNNSIDKTEEMAKEWKILDNKKKDKKKLSSTESAKYKKLSEKLQKNGDLIKDLEKNSTELEDFLGSIDSLNQETTNGISTAQKAIHVASNLSQLDDGLNTFTKVHSYKIAASESSSLENSLNNIDDTQLAFITDKIAHDLEDLGNDTSKYIQSDNTQETVTFAGEYINKATKIENLLGFESKESDQENQITEQDNDFKGSNKLAKGMNDMFESTKGSLNNNPFGFLYSFMAMPQVALFAAATTILSTGYTIAEATALSAERIILGKNIKKSEDEDKKLEQEAQKTIEVFENNNSIIDTNTEKLKELDDKNKNNFNEEVIENKNDMQNIIENKNNDNYSEKAPIVNELNETTDKNNRLKEKISAPLQKSAKLLDLNKKSLSKVDSQAQVLKADEKELVKLSKNTLETGIVNGAAGITNALISSQLMATGNAMLANFNPYGAYLCQVASVWMAISITQVAASPVAMESSVVGFAGAAASKIEYEISDSLAKDSKAATKESKQLITETSEQMGGLNISITEDNEENVPSQTNENSEYEPSKAEAQSDLTRSLATPPEANNTIYPNTAQELTEPKPSSSILENEENTVFDTNINEKMQLDDTEIITDENNNSSSNRSRAMRSPRNSAPYDIEEYFDVMEEDVDDIATIGNNNESIYNTSGARSFNNNLSEDENDIDNEDIETEENINDIDNQDIETEENENEINNKDIPTEENIKETDKDNENENSSNVNAKTRRHSKSNENTPKNSTETEEEKVVKEVPNKETQTSSIPEKELQNEVAKGVAMGKQPEYVALSYIHDKIASPNATYENTDIATSAKNKTNKSNETKDNTVNKEKETNPQDALKSQFGSNIDFAKAFVGLEIATAIGLGPTAFAMQLVAWGVVVGASVADLLIKKGVVNKSGDLAEKDTQASFDAIKSMDAQSKKILAEHAQNVAKAQALSNDYMTLNNDSINYQFEMMQAQQKLVENGRMSEKDINMDITDPNAGAKAIIRANIDKMSSKDSQAIQSMNNPIANSEKINNKSKKSVNDFSDLNNKLSDRNSNNNLVGDLIIADTAIAQGLIIAYMAVIASMGLFSAPLLAAWALTLVKSAALAATGVAAKVVSNKVGNNIDSNNQQVIDNYKQLANDDKKRLDIRKTMAKAGLDKMGNLPAEQSTKDNNTQTQNSNNEENNNTVDNNMTVSTNNSNTNNNKIFETNEQEIRKGFSSSSLNATIDINNPNDVKIANEYAITYTKNVQAANESSKAAAATNTDASSKADTTDKADVKLARFNKSGSIDSRKKSQKVNEVNATRNGKKRR